MNIFKHLPFLPVDLYFVYSPQYKNAGSTVMRGLQLSKIVSSNSRLKTAFSSIDDSYKNSILFITKGVLKTVSSERLAELKKQGNKLLFDPVDESVPDYCLGFADIIVAASYTAYEKYKKEYPQKRVALIHHHVDPRIKSKLRNQTFPELSVGYFGEMSNTITTDEIAKYVDFHHINTSEKSTAWIDAIGNYNFHYAIRNVREIDNVKPFTKGFTAAHCHSNIMIQREGQDEAALWLGEDYPYLLRGEVNESSILSILRYIRESYGSDEWKSALETMQSIEQKTSPAAITSQVLEATELLYTVDTNQ